MSPKTIAILSYITIIGWIVAYIMYKDKTHDSLAKYHLKQSLGIGLLGAFISALSFALPAMATVLSLASLSLLIFWVFGIINAANEQQKPVPLVGSFFENKFDFIK